VPSLDGLSNQRASAIVRGLKEDGLVERVEEKRKAFFQYKPQDSEGEEG
jgi:DNA-binding transcriptional regulator GbsR (MarR family)